MNLYIIRHAIASPAEAAEEDSQRPLTKKGQRKMRKIAQGMRKLEVQADWILTSPYLRALETAKILRNVFELKKNQLIEAEHLSPLGHSDQLINEINQKFAEAQNIILVGHEPYLSSLISVLLFGDAGGALTLKKGGMCKLVVNQLQYGRCAALEWLLSPSQLVELGS